MAAGIAASRKPVKKRKFLAITARDRKDKLKWQHGNQWKKAWRQEKKTTRHYRSGLHTAQVDVQEARFLRRENAKTRSRGKVLKGAGATMMVVGRGLPIIVYGYIGYDIARRLRADDKITKEEVVDELWWYSFGPQAMAISQFKPSSSTSNLLQKMVSRVHGA